MSTSCFFPHTSFRAQLHHNSMLRELDVRVAGALGPFFKPTPQGLFWNAPEHPIANALRRLRIYGEVAINPLLAQARAAYKMNDQAGFISAIAALGHYFFDTKHLVGATLAELAAIIPGSGHGLAEMQGQIPSFWTPGYQTRFEHDSLALGWDWQQVLELFCTMQNDASLPEWMGLVRQSLMELGMYVGFEGPATPPPSNAIPPNTTILTASAASSSSTSSFGFAGQSSSSNGTATAASSQSSAGQSGFGTSLSPDSGPSIVRPSGSEQSVLIPSGKESGPSPPISSFATANGPAMTLAPSSHPPNPAPITKGPGATSTGSAAPSSSAGGGSDGVDAKLPDVGDGDDPDLDDIEVPADENWDGNEPTGKAILGAMRDNVDAIKAELSVLADALNNGTAVDIKRIGALKNTVAMANQSRSKAWFTIADVHVAAYFQCLGNARLILEGNQAVVRRDQKLQNLESHVVGLYKKLSTGKVKTFYDRHASKKKD